ncbi:MAG TPA: hypothetical protein PK573_09375 [Spirochaetota bacterium]|nr:hypothetical protein [Spirochaetota bacterium]HRZ28733.1 hypothetical protein [Spirochaetota bacterium]HSA15693.1 hypothetical protein [Spirochaetota bacterium]
MKKILSICAAVPVALIIFLAASLAGCDGITVGDSQAIATVIDAPTGVSASDGAATDRVTITWNPVDGADYYRVYRCDTETGDFGDTPVGSDWTHLTAASYTDTLLDTGDHYFYRVKAFTDDGLESEFSAADEGYTRVGPPAPTGVDATKGEGASITVTWETNSEAVSYKVWRCETPEGEYTVLADAGDTSTYIDATAVASIYYFYRITAVNVAGESDPSEYAYGYHGSQPAPAPPTNLAATDKTHSDRIVLTWDAGIGASSYTIYRAAWGKTGTGPWTTGPGSYTQIATGITVNTYTDSSSLNPGLYYYYITATNTTGTSPASEVETGYRAITDEEFIELYRETEARLMEKIEDEFGSTPIGSADFPGDIGGVVNYSSTFSGSTGRVSVPYVNYIEYYIIINGTTSTTINIWSLPGSTTGTLTVTGIYPGSIELHLEVDTGGSCGGYYYVTQQGGTRSKVDWTE